VKEAHPTTDLVAYVLGDLAAPRQSRIADHLSACAECRRHAEEFRQLLAGLKASQPLPPPVHWGHYRHELRERIAKRRSGCREWLRFLRPLPIAFAAGAIAVALLIFVMQGGIQTGSSQTDFSIAEELTLFQRLDVFRQYSVLDRLDLLEDLDTIRNLDGTKPREG
jgi:anti-sigma factor RsiW